MSRHAFAPVAVFVIALSLLVGTVVVACAPCASDDCVPGRITTVAGTGDWAYCGNAANVSIQDPLLFYDPGSGMCARCGVNPLDTNHYLRAFRGYWLYTFEDDVTPELPPP